MAITTEGFRLERFSELDEKTSQEIQDTFASEVDLSTDSLMGVLTSLFTNGNADLWELAQGVNDSIGLLSAEDTMLDNAALLVGYVRLPATFTSGLVEVTAVNGAVIARGSTFSSVLGDKFESTQDQIISSNYCTSLRVYVNNVLSNEPYSMSIGINQYVYNSSGSATTEEILIGLRDLVNVDGDVSASIISDLTGIYLDIKWTGSEPVALSSTSYLTFDYVTTPVAVQAVESGAVQANLSTINVLDVPVAGVYSLANKYSLPLGSARESDYSLRKRVIESYETVAGGTTDSIKNHVDSVPNVISTKVVENRTYTTLPSGQSPKSFKTIVYGGLDLDVAKAIWESKAAGVHSWADRTDTVRSRLVTIEDYNGQQHQIQFTRPQVKYVWVQVTITGYSEEALTSGYEAIIKASVEATGDKLGIGNDIIPKRFVGPIYRSVSGLSDVEVAIALTDDLNVTPVSGDYTSVRHSISDEEISNFSVARVTVIDNT